MKFIQILSAEDTTTEIRLLSNRDIEMHGAFHGKQWADRKLAQLEQFYQAREDVYDRVGYKEAERVVQMLFDRAFDIKEQILVVPAHTFEGVLVKLNVARDGTDEDGENFWEQMFRSAHDDMQRVASR